MTRLDPRAPLVVDTRDLPRRAGSQQQLRRRVATPEPFGTDLVAVPAGSPLDLDLRTEAVTEGVLVSGEVSATAQGSCVRCLDSVSVPVRTSVQALFVYPDRAAHHQEVGGEDDDVFELSGDLLDLEPVLLDALVTALPFSPRCRPDCPGLCAVCGLRLADDPDHHHDTVDPRWDALRALAGAAPPETDEGKRT